MGKILLIFQYSVNFQSNIERAPKALQCLRNKVSIISHTENWGLNIYIVIILFCARQMKSYIIMNFGYYGVCMSMCVCVFIKAYQPIESFILLCLPGDSMSTFEPN